MQEADRWIEALAGDEPARREAVTQLLDMGSEAVEPLLAALERNDPSTCGPICFVLARLRDPRAVPGMVAQLESGGMVAALDLSLLGEAAVEPLWAVLRSPEPPVRALAAQALGMIGDRRAVEPLLALLSDGDERTFNAACRALGQLRDPRAVPALMRALMASDGKYCYNVGWALRDLGPELVLSTLQDPFRHPDPQFRAGVARVLGYLRTPEAEAQLIGMLEDPDAGVRLAIAEASWMWERPSLLGAIATRVEREPEASVRHGFLRALHYYRETDHLPGVLRLLRDSSPSVRTAAAELLKETWAPFSVEPLLEALDDPEEPVRAMAARALGRSGLARVIPPVARVLPSLAPPLDPVLRELCNLSGNAAQSYWIDFLSHSQAIVRIAAARGLATKGAVEAAPHLFRALNDADAEVRKWALTGLFRIVPGSAPGLTAMLHDPDREVRKTAAAGFGTARTAEALPGLIGLRNDPDPHVRDAVVHALASIGDPRAGTVVRDLLTDPSHWVRCSAVYALGRMWGARAVPHLLPLLRDDDENEWVLNAAVRQLACHPSPTVIDGLTSFMLNGSQSRRFVVAEVLGKIGDRRAIPALLEALRGHHDLRFHAAQALGKIGDPETALPLAEELHRACRNDDGYAGGQMAEALGKLADPRTLPPLLEALHLTYGYTREAAAIALGKLRDPRAVEGLVAALKDPSPSVVRAVARALGRIGDSQEAGALANRLPEADPETRRALLWALSFTADGREVTPVAAELANSDPAVRVLAARALGRGGSPEAVPTLAHALRDPRGEVRRAAARALARLGAAALPTLLVALTAPDARIRRLAAHSLRSSNCREATVALIAALSDPVIAVRTTAVHSLRQAVFTEKPEVTQALIAALDDSAAAVRAAAAFSLADRETESAAEALRAALRDPAAAVRWAAKSALLRKRRC